MLFVFPTFPKKGIPPQKKKKKSFFLKILEKEYVSLECISLELTPRDESHNFVL